MPSVFPSPTFLVLSTLRRHGNQTTQQLWSEISKSESVIGSKSQLKNRVLKNLTDQRKIFKKYEKEIDTWTWRITDGLEFKEEWVTAEQLHELKKPLIREKKPGPKAWQSERPRDDFVDEDNNTERPSRNYLPEHKVKKSGKRFFW